MSENYKYIAIGPPPKQPRTSIFDPKPRRKNVRKVGTAKVVPVDCEMSPNNIENLKKHNALKRSQGSYVKAGDVIIAAQPFVFVPATGFDN